MFLLKADDCNGNVTPKFQSNLVTQNQLKTINSTSCCHITHN